MNRTNPPPPLGRVEIKGYRRVEGRISFQVIQETLSVITRKFQRAVTGDDVRQMLREVLVPLSRVMPSQGLYERALDIQARYGYGFSDALIVAAALSAGCTRLFTEDLPHGQRIEGLAIENPFAALADPAQASPIR